MQVMWQLDTTLFSMLIQGGLCDQHGNVWRSDPTHTYAVEVTLASTEVLQRLAYFLLHVSE